jgi:nucleotide-binding universal stress UspA family protein
MDGSPLAEAVLPHVQPLARSFNAEVVLLQVMVEPAEAFSVPTSPLSPPKSIRKLQARTKAYLEKVCANLEKEGINAAYLIRNGGVTETILDVAKIMQADLIAMSTHGHSPTRLFLLGSITYQIVRRSPLPVLVIRSESIDGQEELPGD